MARAPSSRGWLALLAGAMAMVAGITALIVLAGSSLQVTRRDRAHAFEEMDAVRAKFGNERPCLDQTRASASPRTERQRPVTVFMLAWEHEDERLVHVTTPYWVLRVGGWKMNVARAVAPPLDHVSLAQIDGCGRGVIADRRLPGGGRVVIWAE